MKDPICVEAVQKGFYGTRIREKGSIFWIQGEKDKDGKLTHLGRWMKKYTGSDKPDLPPPIQLGFKG